MKTKDYFKSTTFFYNNFILKKILENNLSIEEFVLLVYFINFHITNLDIKDVQKNLFLTEEQIFEAYNGLIEKKIITLEIGDNNGKVTETISLDNFINEIDSDAKKSNGNNDFDLIKSSFEKYSKSKVTDEEKIMFNAWFETGFTASDILDAFEKANYNGVFSLRYIDKYLNEDNTVDNKDVSINTNIDDDWLNE